MLEELNQTKESSDTKKHTTYKSKIMRVHKTWESKVMHDQYIRSMYRELIREENTFLWPSREYLKAECESETIAAQDQALQTKHRVTRIFHTETDSRRRRRRRRRLHQRHDKTINHITSACPIWAKEQHIKRRDKGVCSTTL